jgi:hypothetical protein
VYVGHGAKLRLAWRALGQKNAGTRTKSGKTVWRRSFLKTMLNNETYLGVKYYNQMRVIRQYANPIYGIEHSTKKTTKRSREDWIGITVPAIVSQELFDKVQKRLEENRKQYRNPREPHLLSNLVRCGECGSSGYALRRWERSQRKTGPALIIHVRAYKCNWSYQGRLHTNASGIKRCHNPQIKAKLLEAHLKSVSHLATLQLPASMLGKFCCTISRNLANPACASMRVQRYSALDKPHVLMSYCCTQQTCQRCNNEVRF